jgi:hypothetical protein
MYRFYDGSVFNFFFLIYSRINYITVSNKIESAVLWTVAWSSRFFLLLLLLRQYEKPIENRKIFLIKDGFQTNIVS